MRAHRIELSWEAGKSKWRVGMNGEALLRPDGQVPKAAGSVTPQHAAVARGSGTSGVRTTNWESEKRDWECDKTKRAKRAVLTLSEGRRTWVACTNGQDTASRQNRGHFLCAKGPSVSMESL
jgi:hypothetical protein